jgi:peptide deformylase
MATIVQKDDPVLRKIAKPVEESMIGSPELKKIIRDMKSALSAEDDGVAIAAPQIGVSLRMFVLSGKILEVLYPEEYEDPKKKPRDIVFINPKIIKLSREKAEVEEGCLSVRYLYGKIFRAKKARVQAYDEDGKKFEMGGSGLLAQIFQHETDHLDGKLFIDEATDVHDLPPEKIKK